MTKGTKLGESQIKNILTSLINSTTLWHKFFKLLKIC